MWGILSQEQPKEENGETDAEEAKEKSLKLNKRAHRRCCDAQDRKSNRFVKRSVLVLLGGGS